MTDPLPAAVSFGTQLAGTALVPLGGNTYRWGPYDVAAHPAYTVTLTPNVAAGTAFADATVTTVATVAADNADPDSDAASFTMKGDFYIYLPIVLMNG